MDQVPERDREPADGIPPEQLADQPHRRRPAQQREKRAEVDRREVVEGIGRREKGGTEPVGVGGEEMLGEGAAGVVRDDRHRLHRRGIAHCGIDHCQHHVGERRDAQVGRQIHRTPMAPERQVGDNDLDIGVRRQRLDHAVPQVSADEGAVQ